MAKKPMHLDLKKWALHKGEEFSISPLRGQVTFKQTICIGNLEGDENRLLTACQNKSWQQKGDEYNGDDLDLR